MIKWGVCRGGRGQAHPLFLLFLYYMVHSRLFLFMAYCLFACCWPVMAQERVISGTSSLFLTSSDGSIGMMLEPSYAPENDVLTLKGGDYFVLTASSLESYRTMSGRLVVALVRNETEVVDIMASRSLGGLTSFVYFTCKVSDGIEVLPGDQVRLLTTTTGEDYQFVTFLYPGAVVDHIPATDYMLPLCKVSYPENVLGVSIRPGDTAIWPDKVVKGRNFYLYIEPDDAESVLVVRANGISWTGVDGLYALSGVLQDYEIEIKVYPKDAVFAYKEIECTSSLGVEDLLTEAEADCLKGLKVKGEVKAEDFPFFRDRMPSLEILDLTDARIENDMIPERAFDCNQTIQEVKLPETVVSLGSNAFRYMSKLSFIVLPASVCKFGLNEFFGSSIKTVWVKWSPIEAGLEQGFTIPPCAFRATVCASEGTLIIPDGCVDAYKNTPVWSNFKTIREKLPIDFKLELPFSRFLTDVKEVGFAVEEGFSVEVSRGECRIVQDSPAERLVEVIDMNGRMCEVRMMDGAGAVIPLLSGFYIVRVSGKSRKVFVP